MDLPVVSAILVVAWLATAAIASSATPDSLQACFARELELPFVMAYRGASAAFPEHSVGAYRAAIEQGTCRYASPGVLHHQTQAKHRHTRPAPILVTTFPMTGAQFVECDVVLTRDLVPICRHESNIADTTNVLLAAHRRGWDVVPSGNGTEVFAADLTLAQIKQLRAVYPGQAPSATAGTAGTDGGDAKGHCDSDAAAGSCAAPWSGSSELATGNAAAGEAAVDRAETCSWDGTTGGAATGDAAANTAACSDSVPTGADEAAPPAFEVASLEELIWMAVVGLVRLFATWLEGGVSDRPCPNVLQSGLVSVGAWAGGWGLPASACGCCWGSVSAVL